MNYTEEIREVAGKLLSEGVADLVLGYRTPASGEADLPCLVKHPDQVETLVFTDRSAYNLTNYLTREEVKGKRTAIVVKGCDSRALNLLLTENQVKRELVHVIGIACEGIREADGNLQPRCMACVMPDPVLVDTLIGTPLGIRPYQPDEEVERMRLMEISERAAFFEDLVSRCIRCNACRRSCPLCYCQTCCIDHETALLYQGANTPSSAFLALATWSLHLAGRCVDCRNCERACPEHLPLHLMHKQNEEVIYRNFEGYLSGITPGERGALYQYRPGDPEEFIL